MIVREDTLMEEGTLEAKERRVPTGMKTPFK